MESITLDRRGPVLVVSLDRERKRNAINPGMTAGLDRAMNLLEDDPELRVGVLQGSATAFSAGTDLLETSGEPSDRGGEYGLIRRHRSKPLVAAVEGAALGGGFEIVLACDLVVASTDASFGLPEASRGVVAACGGLFRAPRALPVNVARQLLLTGDSISAARAHELGLVNDLVEPGEALGGAMRLAERISSNGPVSVAASLHAVAAVSGLHDESGWRETQAALDAVLCSEDLAEGLAAFQEKRTPHWQGR